MKIKHNYDSFKREQQTNKPEEVASCERKGESEEQERSDQPNEQISEVFVISQELEWEKAAKLDQTLVCVNQNEMLHGVDGCSG